MNVKEQITQNTKYQLIIIIFAGLLAGGYIFSWLSIEILRYSSLSILVTQIWFESKIKQTLFLTSPLFLLSCLSLFFFSFLQGMTIYLSIIPGNSYMSAIGSDAERYIGAFALISFAAHACVQLYIKTNPVTEQFIKSKTNSFIPTVFMSAIFILTVVNIIYFFSPLDKTTTFYNAMRHLSLPLQTFMLVFLIRQTIENTKIFNVFFFVILCISISGMLAVGEGKIPIFIGLALLAYWLRLKNISIKKTVLVSIVFVLFGIAALNVMYLIRSTEMGHYIASNKTYSTDTTQLPSTSEMPGFLTYSTGLTQIPATSDLPNVLKVPVLKLIWRQTDTIYCLKNVVKKHWNEPFILSNQFFWLKAIVPRVIWPEKPSISLGQKYAMKYCGKWKNNPKHILKKVHSSSITLLGQTIIQGGRLGLILHTGILIFVLTGFTLLSRNPSSLSTIVVVTLLPWLIDFDQDFAMYVANATKFFLVTIPLIFCIILLGKRQNII
jgi:hypothetical protein